MQIKIVATNITSSLIYELGSRNAKFEFIHDDSDGGLPDGLVVKVLACHSDNPSSNPVDVGITFFTNVSIKNEKIF